MKISKLFHWLYASVMLLPIFAIGSTCLISTFNMSAKQETETIYKYNTNDVTQASDLKVGNIYKWTFDFTNYTNEGNFANFSGVYINENLYSVNESTDNIQLVMNYSITNRRLRFSNNSVSSTIDYILPSNNIAEIYVIFYSVNFRDNFSNYSLSNFNVIESVETHNLEPENIFYRSIDKVTQSPLFSWAYNSFLVSPFAYIVNLFSMPTNSPVVLLLSYWLSISIIWLVFDIVMYVPLLVHRWLDKGAIE